MVQSGIHDPLKQWKSRMDLESGVGEYKPRESCSATHIPRHGGSWEG